MRQLLLITMRWDAFQRGASVVTKSSMPKKGDKVAWKTPQGETHGTVKGIATKTVKIKHNTIRASEDDPRVVVESDKTGAAAAHKPGSVHKQ
jgi:hypothetical protein